MEESLARASGLYSCLMEQPTYYDVNRACRTCLYTDHMIHSPKVPVFRDDQDGLFPEPYLASILTAPAANAGAIKRNEPGKIAEIELTMRRRIESLLCIARHHGHTDLVLGAWGCGVFANDSEAVAEWFHSSLVHDARFATAFENIVFAVLDRSKDQATFGAFQKRFAP